MRLFDPVYGPQRISHPALLAVLSSAPMLRLQGVMQHGITSLIGVTAPVTRWDHSVGAMILVRRLGGDLPSQLAALLHDVSHTIFSHVIDYVFDDHDGQSYHDSVKAEFVAGTELPAILAEHGFDWREIIREDQFPLLEQPAPALCADRLDYCLRDCLDLGLLSAPAVGALLNDLLVREGRIVMRSLPLARRLADAYLAADDLSWANFREVGLYELTARAIRRALDIGLLTEVDFWRTDQEAWGILRASDDPEIGALLAQVHPESAFVWDERDFTFQVSTKLRTIDPDVLTEDGIRLLSALDPDYARRRDAYLARKAGLWPVRVVPAR